MSLRAKLLLLFALLGLVPILALGIFSYTRSKEVLEDLIRSRTGTLAQRAADEISRLYAQRQSDLLLLGQNAETQNLFRARASGNPATWDAAYASADPYLREAWEVVGSPYQWLEFRDAGGAVLYALGSNPQPGPGVIEFEQPIRDPENSCELGTLATAIHLDMILPYERLDTSFGSEGYSVVLDRENDRILHHPLRAFVQQRTSSLLGPRGWRLDPARLSVGSGSFTLEEGGFSRVASFVSLDSPAWTVIATASLDEFAAPFARTRAIGLILILLIAVTIAIVFYLMTRRVTGSLEGLTAAADEIAGGNFEPWLPPAGNDEVGRLSSAFGVMAGEVREMLRRVEQSRHMAAVGQFASRLSHEIRNPLTSIKLNLQSLERDAARGRIPADCAPPLRICLREIHRLDRVVRGALSLARTRTSTITNCSVHTSVEEAMDVLRPQLGQREVIFKAALQAPRDTVLGDPEKLKGVILNLLLNSAEAMPGGGAIRISTEATGSTIRVRVVDEGPGVPAELKDRIFEPFFSTKKEGTGFGLAVALQTVEEHGGTLQLVDSEAEGSGAAFVVELPLVAEADPK